MEGFLKTILVILLVYYAVKFLARLLMPYFMRYVTKKAGQRMESMFKGFQEQHNPQETTSDAIPKKSKKIVGEYIDYEEIE